MAARLTRPPAKGSVNRHQAQADDDVVRESLQQEGEEGPASLVPADGGGGPPGKAMQGHCDKQDGVEQPEGGAEGA